MNAPDITQRYKKLRIKIILQYWLTFTPLALELWCFNRLLSVKHDKLQGCSKKHCIQKNHRPLCTGCPDFTSGHYTRRCPN